MQADGESLDADLTRSPEYSKNAIADLQSILDHEAALLKKNPDSPEAKRRYVGEILRALKQLTDAADKDTRTLALWAQYPPAAMTAYELGKIAAISQNTIAELEWIPTRYAEPDYEDQIPEEHRDARPKIRKRKPKTYDYAPERESAQEKQKNPQE